MAKHIAALILISISLKFTICILFYGLKYVVWLEVFKYFIVKKFEVFFCFNFCEVISIAWNRDSNCRVRKCFFREIMMLGAKLMTDCFAGWRYTDWNCNFPDWMVFLLQLHDFLLKVKGFDGEQGTGN